MTNQLVNVMINKRLLKEIDQMAERESRSRAEFLREAARQYLRKQKYERTRKDPMRVWQKKYAQKLTGMDVVKEVRKMRETRWK